MIRGLEKQHEQDSQKLIRDTRTLGQRFYDFFDNSEHVAMLIAATGVVAFIAPIVADFILLIGLFFFCMGYFRKARLPFRMPMRSQTLDYNDPLPASTKPRKARGIYYFGNEI